MLPAGEGVRSFGFVSLVDILLANGALQINDSFVLKLPKDGDDLLLSALDFTDLHWTERVHVFAQHLGASLGHRAQEVIAQFVAGTLQRNRQQLAVNPELPGAVVKPQQVTPAPAGQPIKPAGSSATASEREAQRAAVDARDQSELVDAVALGAGGVMMAAAATKVAAVAGVEAAATAAAVSSTAPAATTASAAAHLGTADDGSVQRDPRNPRE